MQYTLHSFWRCLITAFLSGLAASLLLPPVASTQSYKGSISGTVTDAKTLDPLPGANVTVVEAQPSGTTTDINGRFTIKDLPVGSYSLRLSAVGYAPRIITNVVVTTGRSTPVTVTLDEKPVETDEVTVQADYFSRADQLSPLSANVIDRAEIRRSPGGVQDVQRVVQSLPGVASSTDNINELIVRGGAPFENLTVMDYMEIPSINHYSNQFNSAGPINMVNADMIEDVQFSSGGFPAQYGDKSSSVMNITVREGNRDVPFSSLLAFNMAGAGILAEGGFANGKGSYIMSARKSSLEIVDKIVGISSLSLTAIPKYWDTQGKFTYDLSPNHRLKFNFLYGESRIDIEGDPNEKDEQRKDMTDSSAVLRVYPFVRQFAVGANWQQLWGKDGYSVLTLYLSGTHRDENVFSDFTERVYGPNGDVLQHTVLNSRQVYDNISTESFAAAKYDLFFRPDARHEVSAGLQVQTAQLWKNDVWLLGDTARYDLNNDGLFETGPVLTPEYRFSEALGFGRASKYFIYASDKIALSQRVWVTLGARYDHFTYAGQGRFSPRASISYQPVPSLTTLTLAAGRYPQTHPLPYYNDRRVIGYNRNLEHMGADHLVAGFEQILGDGMKASLEAYYKKYDHLAIQEDFILSAVDTLWSDLRLTVGERRSYGVEFLLDRKQVHDLFGTVSLSLSWTKDADPRQPRLTDYYPSDYDYRFIASVLAGYVARGIRSWLDETPFYIKYPSYLLLLSDEVELSFRYRFQTGRPYTPREYVTWKQVREGGLKWSRGAWINTDRINGARYPDYSRLDLQWISRFYFDTWNINVYISLQNVLNKKNVFFQEYRSDGTVETVYQFSFFPVLGVEAEF